MLVFDVMASSSGASSSSQGGQALQSVADFLDTLAPDPSVGLFTDYNTHAPITGIVGPAAVVIPPAPGSIVFSPASVTNQIGTQASVRAVVTAADATPVTNTFVRFAITSGPHAGLTGPVGTDAYGNATITAMTDTLGASRNRFHSDNKRFGCVEHRPDRMDQSRRARSSDTQSRNRFHLHRRFTDLQRHRV